MLEPHGTDTWLSDPLWPCLMSIMNTYFLRDTIEIFSLEDISPIFPLSNKTLYQSSTFETNGNPYTTDLLLVASVLPKKRFQGRFHKTIFVTMDKSSAFPYWTETRLLDSVILVPNGSVVDAWLWFPYIPGRCRKEISLVHYDKCSGGEWGRNMYPQKIPQHFSGCPVVYHPYNIAPDVLLNPPNHWYGREVVMMEIIAESLGLEVKYLNPTNYSYFYPGQYYSLSEVLYRGEADFGFASLIYYEGFLKVTDQLPAFREEQLVWILPKPAPQPRARGIYSGFPNEMWFTIVFIIVLVTILAKAIALVEGRTWLWLDAIAITVASPVTSKSSLPLRVFTFIFQVYGLHIAWFYQSTLLGNLFKSPMQRPIKNIQEAVNLGYPLYTLSWYSTYFNHSEHDMWNKILSPQGHKYVYPLDYDIAVIEKSGVLLANLGRDGVAMRRKYKDSLTNLVQVQTFVRNPVIVYAVMGSPLTKRYIKQMYAFIESGLYLHLTSLETGYADFPNLDKEASSARISLDLVEYVFLLNSFILVISFLIFLLEVCVGKISCKEKNHKRRNRAQELVVKMKVIRDIGPEE